MKGSCLFFLFGYFLVNAAAIGSTLISSKFDFVLHNGNRQSFSVKWQQGKIYLENQPLPGLGAVMGRSALAQTLKLRANAESNSPIGCTAGRYRHSVSRGSEEKVEWGCVTDPQFTAKVRAFRRLLKLAWTLPKD